MNAPGEIMRGLSEIARPGVGLITTSPLPILQKLHSGGGGSRQRRAFRKMGNDGTIRVNNRIRGSERSPKVGRGLA